MHLRTPEVFSPVLDRLRVDAAAHYSVGRLRLEPVKYENREFSHLLRMAAYSNGKETPFTHLFVKMTKPKLIDGSLDILRGRIVRDFEITKRVHSSMFRSADVGVVPPVACYPEHLAIVTEEVAGPTLQQYLTSGATWFPMSSRINDLCATMTAAGRWIRVFQATAPAGNVIARESFRDYIDHRLKRLVQHPRSKFTAGDRDRVLGHVERLCDQVPAAELREVPVHSDLALGNILVNGRKIVVLDFTMAKTGAALHDLTRLFVQIDLLAVKPHVRQSVIERIQRSLLVGYDPALTSDRPLFRLLLVLHRINHLVTVVFQQAGPVGGAYNRLVARRHRQWLAVETGRGVSRGAAV